jgi:hypothetical protein
MDPPWEVQKIDREVRLNQDAFDYPLGLPMDATTLEILEKALHAEAPPLLAPGMKMQLGLLGLAYVYSDSSSEGRGRLWGSACVNIPAAYPEKSLPPHP